MVRAIIVVLFLFAQLNSFLTINEAVMFNDDYDYSGFTPFALYRIVAGISFEILKNDCYQTAKITPEDAWKMLETVQQELVNKNIKIDLIIKGVHAKRFIDMRVSDCKLITSDEVILENVAESITSWEPSLNVTKTDRIKIYNARSLSFKNAFNAAIIGDPIIFKTNEAALTKNVTKIVNLKFESLNVGGTKPVKGRYSIRRGYMFFTYFIDFEIDEDASITTKGYCSNTGSQTISFKKFLDENPEIFSNWEYYDDDIKLERSNEKLILKNFPAKQITESVILSEYGCCW